METALEERIQIALSKAVEFLEAQGYRYAVNRDIQKRIATVLAQTRQGEA